jgi:hypothetical protein
MPTPASPDTNHFHCKACGRFFNSAEELKSHAIECEAAKASQPSKENATEQSYADDREWKSVP